MATGIHPAAPLIYAVGRKSRLILQKKLSNNRILTGYKQNVAYKDTKIVKHLRQTKPM